MAAPRRRPGRSIGSRREYRAIPPPRADAVLALAEVYADTDVLPPPDLVGPDAPSATRTDPST